jgi:hypothetical protein
MNKDTKIVVVLAVCHNDFHLAEKWLAWAALLACSTEHGEPYSGDQCYDSYRLIVFCTKSLEPELMRRLRELADKFPFFVEIAETPTLYEQGYTPSANFMFRCALEHVERFYPGRAMLWCEADTVPMHKDWVPAIEEEYQKCGKAFLGDYHECEISHMTGNAVYSPNWRQLAPSLARLPQPRPEQGWDSMCAHETVPQMARSKTIQQVWRPPLITDAWLQENIPDTTALFHQCKDGSLIDVLCGYARKTRIKLREPLPRPERSQGASNGLRMEILIVTHARDIPFLEYCIKSIRKFTSGFNGVTIAAPDTEMSAFAKFASNDVKVVHYADVPGKGMLRHLAIKCRADEMCPTADAVLHMDADCMFWDEATPDDFMSAGRLILVRERYDDLTNPNRRFWRDGVQRAVGFRPEWETMVRHPQVYPVDLYRWVRKLVEATNGMPFDHFVTTGKNEFPQSFCEFNTIGAVGVRDFAERFTFVNYDPAKDAGECGVSMKHTSFQYLYRAGRDKVVEMWSHGGAEAYKKDMDRFLAGNRPSFQIK